MGKRSHNKKKVLGSVKTAMKTEKKLNAKQKKELTAIGEDDIEKILAQVEMEEAQRQKVTEIVVDQPSRRVNFTLSPHPFKDELIMLGGEFYDGRKITVYGDMFFYNLNKNIWTVIKVPGSPPPRCGHQALTIPNNKGELWVFGGEYSSPSESQFYHYKDLWVYYIGDKKWEKVSASGGPSPRSGHRMLYEKRQLIVFGGFYDNLRDFKYYNDLYIFDLASYKWNKINLTGSIPPPRSGCITLPTSDNKILVYGGYSKEKVKKDIDRGQVHTDMYILEADKHDKTNLKWKSVQVKPSGTRISPRCSSSAVLVQANTAYIFGGVYDIQENDEEIQGIFFNDLLALDLQKHQWRSVNLNCNKEKSRIGRRQRIDNEELKTVEPDVTPIFTTMDDGIFTITVNSTPVTSANLNSNEIKKNIFCPSPRINPGLAVKNNVLYLYGGMYEDGDRQYTFNDLYKLDILKLNEWQTIIEDDVSEQVWFDIDTSEDDDDNDDGMKEIEIDET